MICPNCGEPVAPLTLDGEFLLARGGLSAAALSQRQYDLIGLFLRTGRPLNIDWIGSTLDLPLRTVRRDISQTRRRLEKLGWTIITTSRRDHARDFTAYLLAHVEPNPLTLAARRREHLRREARAA